MTEFSLGVEDGTGDGGAWTDLDPQRGEVLEVYMPKTNWFNPGDFWAAFLVFEKKLLADGSLLVTVRCMGCEDVELFKTLQRRMNVTGGQLHLCHTSPCTVVEGDEETAQAIHVTQVRRWEFMDIIKAEYISRSMRTQCRSWYGEIMEGRLPLGGPPPGRSKGKKPPKERGAGNTRAPGADAKGTKKTGLGLSEAAKTRLKERLKLVRERALGTGALSEPVMISDGEGGIEQSSPEEEDSSSAQDRGKKRAPAVPFPPVPPMALADLKVKKEPKEKKAKKKKKRVGLQEEKEDRKVRREAGGDDSRLVALSGSTSKSWRRQLVDKAVLAAETRSRDKKKKEKKKDSHSKKVQRALALILTGSSKKDKKDREKKKKKRRRMMTSDGVIESFSESSSEDTSESTQSSSEESHLDTPMKKRSKDAPGSVLAMLVNHVKEQLDQGATTELPTEVSALTSGIRVMTYFMLHLKPSFAGNVKELRELHHLAACIDVLRSGDIARTGDGLAARFISIHQALLDQSWGTAKHMELFPMEDTSAASTSMVLATRKHTKLISKVQNQQAWNLWGNPYHRGRGKGKGDWSSGYDYKGEYKGEKGKGKKGKTKGKGKWNHSDEQDWKGSKEKPEDKKA